MAPTPKAAPPMSADDAPIGMGSLDVVIDMGEAVSHVVADELPVQTATATTATTAMATTATMAMATTSTATTDALPDDPVALLEELLRRVGKNRHAA